MRIIHAFMFEAAHRAPHVPVGHKCARVHGHSYRVEVELTGTINPETGFVMDFYEIEAAFRPLFEQLDHHYLNDVDGLAIPSTENITLWIWQRLKPTLPLLSAVTVHETTNCSARYEGNV
jgi:6-pyruvoyltetrahydropterin/6-carboxytetrahydropterin synthase